MRRSCGRLAMLNRARGPGMRPSAKLAAIAAAMLAVSVLPSGARAEIVVTVDKARQQMAVVVDGEHLYTWPVSTGLGGTPSGSFRAQLLSRNHRSSIFGNAPMPFAIFYSGHFAIHGTTAIAQLG